jgi:hypothetical protein
VSVCVRSSLGSRQLEIHTASEPFTEPPLLWPDPANRANHYATGAKPAQALESLQRRHYGCHALPNGVAAYDALPAGAQEEYVRRFGVPSSV